VVERKNIFSFGPARTASDFGRLDPFAAFRTTEPEPTTVENLERRLSMAERAADQARRDLDAAKSRKGLQGEDEKTSRWYRQAVLDERARILAILTNPIALRQPRLAEKFALESDVPARDAIAAMEENERVNAAGSAKSLAAKIIHAGEVRRGLADAPTTAAPKRFVKATPEDILAAARKARGQD
jgi:hypothetical protein